MKHYFNSDEFQKNWLNCFIKLLSVEQLEDLDKEGHITIHDWEEVKRIKKSQEDEKLLSTF